MDDVLKNRELVSALADGQLRGSDLAAAVRLAASDPDAQATWQVYHLASDVLRSSELASASSDASFMARLRVSLAQEVIADAALVLALVPAQSAAVAATQPAANEPGFRWKLVAGVASFVAVGALGWTALGGAGNGGQAELARAAVGQPAVVATASTAAPVQTQAQVTVAGTPQIMIRDPRLDELLSAHRQFGGTSALQMPAGFLRNATFENPGR